MDIETQKEELSREALYHSEAAKWMLTMHMYLGIPIKVCPFIASSAVTGSLALECRKELVGVTGISSFVGGLFVILRDILNYRRAAEQHHEASLAYSELRRDLTLFSLNQPASNDTFTQLHFEDKRRLIDNSAPSVSDCIKRSVDRMITEKKHDISSNEIRLKRMRSHNPHMSSVEAGAVCSELKELPDEALRWICNEINKNASSNTHQPVFARMTREEMLDYLALDANRPLPGQLPPIEPQLNAV